MAGGIVQLNTAQRAIVDKGRVSACVVTGTDKIKSGYGNGDCLLLDFRNLFFAVSDASERWSTASRRLLRRLAKSLPKESPADKDQWLEAVNAAYAKQKYIHRCTFSGVAITPEKNGFTATIIHGGDSLILVMNLKTGAVDYHTAADMSFAGRAKKIYGAKTLEFKGDHFRIILASDGLSDLARLSGQGLYEMCSAAVLAFSTHKAPEKLIQFLARQRGAINHDDIGIIAINPMKIRRAKNLCLLLGGTTPGEEGKFQDRSKKGKIQDVWLAPEQLDPADRQLRACGFRKIE